MAIFMDEIWCHLLLVTQRDVKALCAYFVIFCFLRAGKSQSRNVHAHTQYSHVNYVTFFFKKKSNISIRFGKFFSRGEILLRRFDCLCIFLLFECNINLLLVCISIF